MITFIAQYWFILIATLAIGIVAGFAIYNFMRKPKAEQLIKVEEWLLYAVTEAEREFGTGTGQIKLRAVYDMFLVRFPQISALIGFEQFSMMVDGALVKLKKMLNNNPKVADYVEKEGTF